MKKTDFMLKLISLILFIGMLAYIGVYVLRSISDPVQTALAVEAVMSERAAAGGVILREETVVESGEAYIEITAADGRMAAGGETVAVAYSSEEALARANEIRTLQLELERTQSILNAVSSAQDAAERETEIYEAITALSYALTSRDLSELDGASVTLRSLVLDSDSEPVTTENVYELERRIYELQDSAQGGAVEIKAPQSGLFSSAVDGYEDLRPADMKGSSPERLRNLMQSGRSPDALAVGKLITSYDWYFAAVMEEKDAARLFSLGEASLSFGRYYDGLLPAEVWDIGEAVDGECVVIFRCSTGLVDTLAVRQVAAEVIFKEYTGIRVPTKALHTDEDGSYYVYTMTGLQAEQKAVELIYEGEEYCLVSSSGEDALRVGNEIIVSAKDLHDGKVMD